MESLRSVCDLEERFRIFSERNLEFEEAQIGVTNELSRQVLAINKKIEKFENDEKKYKVLVDRKNNIQSLIAILKDSVSRVIDIINKWRSGHNNRVS